MKKILVAGGAGFIGCNLIETLFESNNEIFIYCLDNFFTGNTLNINKFKSFKNFKLIEHDIIDPIDINVDEIYNLACPASPVHYQSDPIKTAKTSILGSINLLNLANKYNSKILLASTSEVYGDPLVHPQNEDYWGNVNPIGIRSCYDESKRCSESFFLDYYRQYGLRIKIARIFNTYGPYMSPEDGRVISNFIVSSLKKLPHEIYGDGSQTRSFCYVSDLVSGLIKLMKSDDAIIGPINLGNDIEFTVKEISEKISQIAEVELKQVFKDLPLDDPTKRRPDIQRAKELLTWSPAVSVDEGISKTISYFKKIIVTGSLGRTRTATGINPTGF